MLLNFLNIVCCGSKIFYKIFIGFVGEYCSFDFLIGLLFLGYL